MKQFLEVCKAVTTHGIAGELKVELWCDDAAFLAGFPCLYRGANGENPIQVAKVRPHKNMALVTFEGIDDMNAARDLVGTVFYIARADAKLPQGHYFQADLLGCQVVDADSGKVYGLIEAVNRPTIQDIYTIKQPDGSVALFPAVKPFVVKIDIENAKVLIRPIAGMFDTAQDGDKA